MGKKVWGGNIPEEVIFKQSEGRVNICQAWKVMREEGSINSSTGGVTQMGREKGEQWFMDGR